jgi:hypothetical protein
LVYRAADGEKAGKRVIHIVTQKLAEFIVSHSLIEEVLFEPAGHCALIGKVLSCSAHETGLWLKALNYAAFGGALPHQTH